MKKTLLISILFLAFISKILSQVKKEPASTKPRLVVMIIVDQMRNDNIYRYWGRYSNGGFKKLVNEGYYFKNAHFNYIPTYTGPGHASIATGATPSAHGIIANDWYSKKNRTTTYCVLDTNVKSAGTKNKNGMMSPKNLLSSTIGDELKMNSNRRSKVFAVALKDRSAVLPAGHAANGAFWYDDATGDFISSTWYMDDIPRWLKNFNDEKLPATYLQKGWQTLYPVETYTNSVADDNRYESAPNKKEKPVFPYEYQSELDKNNFGILKATPFGNSLTKDIALECIKKEELGKDDETDFISISFSSTDIIGHAYGSRSIESEDTYLRLDKDIEMILASLDKEVGRNNYIITLTADHGGADVPNHLSDHKIPAGHVHEKNIARQVKVLLNETYGDSSLILNGSNEQIFLNESRLKEMKLDKDLIEDRICSYLVTLPAVAEAYPSRILKNRTGCRNDYLALLQNGYNHKLSGNIAYIYQPGYLDYSPTGTTHGSGYNYDTHVPVIFFGKGIKSGSTYNYTTITQIAPTICELLEISRPNASIAEPLNSFFR
jgi:predicted AlkP superfamily pyrophosphatase or phosphodiesterase